MRVRDLVQNLELHYLALVLQGCGIAGTPLKFVPFPLNSVTDISQCKKSVVCYLNINYSENIVSYKYPYERPFVS